MVILPGYDCLTEVGIHLGPCLRSNRKQGHLMYGPYRSLASGDYQVRIFDTPSLRKPSTLYFDVLHGEDSETLAGQHLVINERSCVNPTDAPLITFNFSAPRALSRCEVRCYLFNGGIEISKVVIQPLGMAAQPKDVPQLNLGRAQPLQQSLHQTANTI